MDKLIEWDPKAHAQVKSVVMISYVPLLIGDAGVCYDAEVSSLQKTIDQAPNGRASACIWLRTKDSAGDLAPCFLIENAEATAGHLKIWSEGKPEEWFKLCVAEHGGLYGIALVPRIDRSIDRFRAAFQLRHGLPLPKDLLVTALFVPLHFISQPGHLLEQMKPLLKNPCRLLLLEESKFNSPNWQVHLIDLGSFEFDFDAPEKSCIEQQLADQLKVGRA